MATPNLPNPRRSLKICVTCKQEFLTLPNKHDQKYCSKPCYSSIHIGTNVHALTVESAVPGRSINGCRLWLCRCECGGSVVLSSARLKAGSPKSCGCQWPKHGMFGSPVYATWASMLARCQNPSHAAYKRYGGRGITVCERWQKSFENFYADMGDRPAGLTLERKDNNKGYSPDNCKWATRKAQRNNQNVCVRITFEGLSLTAPQWARLLGIRPRLLHYRLHHGFSFVDSVTNRVLKRPQPTGNNRRTRKDAGVSKPVYDLFRKNRRV